MPLVAAVLVLAVGSYYAVVSLSRGHEQGQRPINATGKTFQVLVANFSNPAPDGTDVAGLVLGQVRERLAPYSKNIEVRPLAEEITQRNSREVLQRLSHDERNSVVLWGQVLPRPAKTPELLVTMSMLHPPPDFPAVNASPTGNIEVQPEGSDILTVRTELSKRLSYLTLFIAGVSLYSQGKWEEAILNLRGADGELVNEASGDADRYALSYYLGNSYRKADPGAYDAALSYYDRAIATRGDKPAAYIPRGMLFKGRGDNTNDSRYFDRAIADFDTALRIDPNYGPALHRRSIVNRGLMRYDAALADATAAIVQLPNFVGAYLNRGIIHNEKGEYDLAISDFGAALRLDPTMYAAVQNRGISYRQLGRYELAEKDFAESIRLLPHSYFAYLSRGVMYLDMNRPEPALADFREAVDIVKKPAAPGSAVSHYYLGLAQQAMGQNQDAVVSIGEALAISPTSEVARVALARSYRALGRNDEAETAYRQVLVEPARPTPSPTGWQIWSDVDQEYRGDAQILALSRSDPARDEATRALQ